MRGSRWVTDASVAAMVCVLGLSGCGGDARVELAAANAIESLTASIETALVEYRGEVETADDAREAMAVDAFAIRIQRDAQDDAAVAAHVDQFGLALHKLQRDRRTEWARHQAAMENAALLRETAQGLRRLAVDSMKLENQTRQYLLSLIEAGVGPDRSSSSRKRKAIRE